MRKAIFGKVIERCVFLVGMVLGPNVLAVNPPTITASRDPVLMVNGRNYALTWASTDATSVTNTCTSTGTGFTGSIPSPTVSGVSHGTSKPEWVGYPSTCVWTATGPGGSATFTETMSTYDEEPYPPQAMVSATPSNIRVASGQSTSVLISGSAKEVAGRIVKVELFKDSGAGYGAAPVQVVNGVGESLNLSYSTSLAPGTYRFKLRGTDYVGNTVESTPVSVNLVDSPLLGTMTGVRYNPVVNGVSISEPRTLVGWVCQDAVAQSLPYQVYVNAPSSLGGVMVASGLANVATETDNEAVQAQCHTAGVPHHFKVNLGDLYSNYGYAPLFVEAQAASGNATIVLPCSDINCTIPVSNSLYISSPAHGDRFTAGGTVVVRAQTPGAATTYDEVAFSFNGQWFPATKGSSGEYFINKTGLAASSTPYTIQARIRKGSETVYSMPRQIYVVAAGQTTIALSPVNYAQVTALRATGMRAVTQGPINAVKDMKFYVDGVLLGSGVTSEDGPDTWDITWPAAQQGTYALSARAFNGSGVQIGQSLVSNVSAVLSSGSFPAPELSVMRTPSTMIAGQPLSLTWTSKNLLSLGVVCTANNGGYTTNGWKTLAFNDAEVGTANQNWVGAPSTCTWTGGGPGGTISYVEIMTTVAAPAGAPASANPVVTMSGPLAGSAYVTGSTSVDSTAAVAVTGSATPASGYTIANLEVIEDGVSLSSPNATNNINAVVALKEGRHQLQLRATDNGGHVASSAAVPVDVTRLTEGANAKFIAQDVPATMRAGQPYNVTVQMQNTGTTTWTAAGGFRLGAQNPQDTRIWNSVGRAYLAASVPSGQTATFTIPITAPQRAGTYNFQWKMVQDGVTWFGESTVNLTITVADGAGPTATLSASPTNVRMVGSTPATLTLVAGGAEAGHKVTKLEVFLDTGTGFPDTAAKTATGDLESLSLNYTATATAGVYKYKARSTDENGVQTDSPIVLVNVTNSALLGQVTGVRIDGSKMPELIGWLCQPGVAQALSYQVLLDAPAISIGGTVLSSGTANIGTEVDDAAVRASCGTPGASHHFKIDLTDYSTQYAGRAIYVQGQAASGGTNVVLPCADNSCTIPGGLRIALSTPPNGQRYAGPATVFMKTMLSGGAGPYDEVALSVDGVWTTANPDGAVDAYSLSSAPLAARNAPYAVQSRVRQGNTTLYSTANVVYVDVPGIVTITLASPVAGAVATGGDNLNLSATIGSGGTTVASVKFYANGQLVATGAVNGGTWTGSWNNVPAGTYSMTAVVYDGSGVQLAQSAAVSITVSSSGSSDTPVPIVVTVDQLSNGEGGALPGGVSVSNDGSAGYSVPVKLPPGILGMAPEISLSYDSNTPSGLAGLGWTLGGIAHIDRCGKIAATDGRSDGVRFSSYIGTPGVFGPYANQPADRLCLQGQRLILVNGNSANDADYWADGAIYRTEVETFTRVTAFVSNGKRAFKAEGRNGRTSYFGDTDDSYIEAQGRADGLAHRWYQSRATDRSGNYISYRYNENTTTGEHNPASISWGGNTQQATVHFAKVEFGYEDRTDPRTSYIAGSQISETKRLASIKTSVIASDDSSGAFATALTYTLAYETSPTSGRSLLHSVGACDGASHCLPATVFSWGKPDPSAQKAFVALGGVRTGPDLFALADNNPVGNKYVSTAMASIVAADFNGDGKTDILERYRVAANNFQQRLYTSNSSGTVWTVSTPLANVTGSATIIETGDFDGDGLPDLLVNEDSTGAWSLCLSSRRSGGNYACDLPVTGIPAAAFGTVPVGVPTRVVKDYNADGKDDLALRSDNSEQRRAFQCLSTGTDFNCIEVTQTADEPFFGDRPGETGTLLSTDADGDGRVDSILLSKCRWDIPLNETHYRWVCGSSAFGPDAGGLTVFGQGERGAVKTTGGWYQFPNKKTQILSQSSFGTLGSDLNADGYTDLVFGSVDLSTITSLQTPVFSSAICYARGDGNGECRTLPASNHVNGVNRDHLVMTLGDFDGDGIYDVLRPLNDTWEETNVSGYQVCRIGTDTSIGADPLYQRCDAWTGPTFYSQPGILLEDADNDQGFGVSRSMFLGDFDGDGKQDIVVYQAGGQWQVYGAANQAMPGQALDKLVSVKNGMGREDRVDYALSNDSSVYQSTVSRDDGANTEGRLTYPGRPLVKALHADNGVAGVRDTTYRYFRQASDKSGRGSLGFAQVERTDVQRGIVTTSAPCLSFPYIGMDCLSKDVTTAGIVLSSSATTWASLPFTHASGGKTVMPYVSSATVVRKDPDGNDLGKTVTTTTKLDAWGNVLDTKTVSSSDSNTSGFSVQKVMVYQNEESTWRLGEMTSSTETRSNSYGTTSRQSTYSYDAQGLLASESRISTDNAQALTTTYDRTGTGFGLVGKTTLSWTDADGAAATRTVSDVGYTANGRFVSTVKNALLQQESRTFDVRTGQATSVTSVNGLTSYAAYDGFGRQLTATGVDGIVAGTSYRNCAASCPVGAAGVIVQEMKDANGARAAVPTLQFIDNAGRAIRTATWGFDGRKIVNDVVYDALGRTKTAYWPRYVAAGGELDATPAGARIRTTTLYDVLDRVLSVQTVDEAGQPQTTTHQWLGFQRTTTNPKAQAIVELKDVWGKLAWTKDAKQKQTQFAFDAFGNLRQTTDSLNNVVTVTFDDWGRRTDLKDPDLGWIHYQVDPLGQVLNQVSPNQRPAKSTVMTYDVLGRMITRTAGDLVAGWTYDVMDGQTNCATYKSCGQLVESFTKNGASKDYRQQHTYDALGRPDTTTTILDKNYTSKIGYDSWGRVVRETAQRGSDAAKVYDRRYNAYGQLVRIERGATVVWKATQQDALGQVTSATLGNGFVAGRSYDLNTGRLSGATLDDAQGVSRLKEDYVYDALGNVSQRTQAWGAVSFIESFDYDALNRLKSATILGYAQQNFTYDDIGNIVSKTGAGTGNYVYPASGASSVRPHAVSSIPGLGSFVYDDNGNMTSGAGRTVTWNSFDMPVTITKGTEKSTFYYGPDHQRIRQVRSDGITTYYAGAMEVEVTSTAETVKTYLPLGLGVEIDKAGATQLNYLHRDRLGSMVAISGEAGGVLVEMQAYDSWGKRRDTATPVTPDTIDGVVDNKGYTGHEMLDKLDLVHMNGRVYDPLVARFMSADPFIQDPTHSQSYNRYTYVWNNPTNLTDPTGFAAKDVTAASIRRQQCSTSVSDGCSNAFDSAESGSEEKAQGDNTDNSPTKEKSGGKNVTRPVTSGTPVTNLTQGDIVQSWAAGFGNRVANWGVGAANFLIAMSPGEAELIDPVQPFTPRSNYFAQRGGDTADGLSLVTGGTAFGKGLAGLAEAKVVQLGGAYRDVKGMAGYEAHHMPADSVTSLSKESGPSIAMLKDDHRMTASWGNSREARAYRAQQVELVGNGKFMDAVRMDVRDIQSKFGTKYNQAINQMMDYMKAQGYK
jgi:RHS repeat-associated protein